MACRASTFLTGCMLLEGKSGFFFIEMPSLSHKENEGIKLLEHKYSHRKKVVLSQLENGPDKSVSKAVEKPHNIFGRLQSVKSASDEQKVILEVPLADENVKDVSHFESETKTEDTGNALDLDHGFLAGKKRSKSSFNSLDASLKQRQEKKRRHGRDSASTPLGEITANCVVSVSVEVNGLTPLDRYLRNPKGNGDDVDEVRTLDGTDKSNDSKSYVKAVKLDSLQTFSLISNQDDSQGKVSGRISSSKRVSNGTSKVQIIPFKASPFL